MEDIQAIEDLVDTYLGVEDESDVEEAKATLRDKIETLVEDEEQKETFLADFPSGNRCSGAVGRHSSYRRLSGYVLGC
ncbi:hypothetical protein [Dolosigranulum savutiense]|uniref:Uncharacterized protein n=1 Tax=Dolosigranulum savutiense TaxID=3110288 RepID=A0AB74U7R1_9LACT